VDETLAIDGGQPVRRRPLPSPGPELAPEDAEAVAQVVRSGQLWRHGGTQVRDLEAEFAALHGVPPSAVVASTSGTAAVHVAVGTVDPAPGDEIIVPPLTDFGTVLPILAQNAIPVFADVRPDTWCLDPEDVARKISPRTRAIVAVHLFGQPCDLDALGQLSAARGLALIEDCAQAVLAEWRGRPVGTWSDFGCFSLQQSKHCTAGEGGLTIVRSPERAARARLFADKGWPREGAVRTYVHFGMNYRMTEMQGALVRAQLPRLPGLLARRRALAARLDAALAEVPGVQVPRLPAHARGSYWQYVFRVADQAADFSRAVRAEGVPLASGYVTPLYLTPALRERRFYGDSGFPFDTPYARPQPAFAPGLCPVAESAAAHLCYFPLHQGLSEEDVDDVAAAVAKVAHAFVRRGRWPA
jgi:perosamine synthetase